MKGLVCAQHNRRGGRAAAAQDSRLHRRAAALTVLAMNSAWRCRAAKPSPAAASAKAEIPPSGLFHGTSSGGLPNSTEGHGRRGAPGQVQVGAGAGEGLGARSGQGRDSEPQRLPH